MKINAHQNTIICIFIVVSIASCGGGMRRQVRTTQEVGQPSAKESKLNELRDYIDNLTGELNKAKATRAADKYVDLEEKIQSKNQEIEALTTSPEMLKLNTDIEKSKKYIATMTDLLEQASTNVSNMRGCLGTLNIYVGGVPLASFDEDCKNENHELMSQAEMQAIKDANEPRIAGRQNAIDTANKKLTELTESLSTKIKPLQESLQVLEAYKNEAQNLDKSITDLEKDIIHLTDAGQNCTVSAECDAEFVTSLLKS